MIVDLTSARMLERLLDADSRAALHDSEVLGHPWRNLILADVEPETPAQAQVEALAARHLDADELQLRAGPALVPAERAAWRGFVANALVYGLAYGPLSADVARDHPPTARVVGFLDALIAALVDPVLLSNFHLPGRAGPEGRSISFDSLSDHTFSALCVAHDHDHLAAFVIVDED